MQHINVSTSNIHLNPISPKRTSVRLCESSPALSLRIVKLVADRAGVQMGMMFHASRCRSDISLARQLAMYLLHVCAGMQLFKIGILFSRDRSTVSHACGKIEDLRDTATFDRRVAALEKDVLTLIAETTSDECQIGARNV